ncbi:MAG: SDR family NAD(P)-dependent oxidoreductase [Spirochaetia bacterium]
MRFDLEGKLVIVTGASSGLGRAIALALAMDEGADVIVAARRKERLAELSREIRERSGRNAYPVDVDLGTPDGPDALFLTARQIVAGRRRTERRRTGRRRAERDRVVTSANPGVFGLVNNAGITHYGETVGMDRDAIDSVLQINLLAAMHLSRLFLPLFVARGCGVILNVTSLGAVLPVPYQAVYAASKHGLRAFTESLAAEVRGTGVVVSSFGPGGIDTEMIGSSGLGGRVASGSVFLADPAVIAVKAIRHWKRGVVSGTGGLLLRIASATACLPTGRLIRRITATFYKPPAPHLRQTPWDQSLAGDAYLFGAGPTDWFGTAAAQIPTGRALCIGDGESSNSVYLAQLGHDVSAIDRSSVGMEKAERLASERGVEIRTEVTDLTSYRFGSNRWDVINSAFVHMSPSLRIDVHARMVEAIVPGGYLIHESLAPDQLRYSTGGPTRPEMLPGLERLKTEFAGLDFEIDLEVVRDVADGPGNRNPGGRKSAVVQILARKPRW